MTNDDRLMAEIREANLSYLILAQTLIRADKVQALFRLGISDAVADVIAALTPGQILKVASGNMLMCRFRFDDDMVWQLLTDHGRPASDTTQTNAGRLHASILMAGNFSEATQS